MWLVKKDFPLPVGPRINLLRLVHIPLRIGSSEISTWRGLPERRSPSRIPVGLIEVSLLVSRLRKQLACSAKVSKVSFTGRSAALPGTPAQKICGAPTLSCLQSAPILDMAEVTMFTSEGSSLWSHVQARTLKCALTGRRCCVSASCRKSSVESLATLFARLYADRD